MEWQFLVNCADDFEAGIIMGVLKEAGIVTIKKYRGPGDNMKVIGGVGKDVDIFVPAGQLSKARQILDFLEEKAAEEAAEEGAEEAPGEEE